MAALLKKRAVAEFSQVIQEEPRPIKKLKLVQKPLLPEVHLDLTVGTSTQEAVSSLIHLERQLSQIGENAVNIVRQLVDHYHREKESVVRWKIAHILGLLSKHPQCAADTIVEEIISLLKTEKSHKVVGQLIQSLQTVGLSAPDNRDLHLKIVQLAREHSKHTQHVVRSSCLNLIGAVGSQDTISKDTDQSEEHISVQTLLISFTQDQDPRVRSSAFRAVQQLHQRGQSIDLSVYDRTCKALTDDYEDVRTAAVKLMWILCHLYPESTVPVPESDDEIRLVDDGFAKICNMMNDISMKVRVEAATLLGSLHQVSPKFLEQTLDKKLMSNMRQKKSAHERAKDHYASGEWSSGQKWADDAPKDEVAPESVTLMNMGACGAFVHGTEDEFLEVRNAALDSLCELAAQSQEFAILSQDSIIDMFNDEIESVRLNAINSLRKLSNHVTLREDQLEIILGVLQDFSTTTREALRDMLCDVRVSTKESLNACIVGLLDNLRRYPQDKRSVWKCMKFLGKQHPHLTLPLVPTLLCLHPYFDTPEPDMDDPAYISVLLMVFNAAFSCPTMMTMFEDYTWQHYTYLRESLPDLVPVLKNQNEDKDDNLPGSSSSVSSFIQQITQQVENICSMENNTAQQMLQVIVKDLHKISELDSRNSASAECIGNFLQSQLLLTQLMTKQTVSSSCIMDNHTLATVEKILELTKICQHIFVGLGIAEIGLIRQTELKAITIQILTLMKAEMTNEKQQDMKQNYTKLIKNLKSYLLSSQCHPDAFTTYIFSVVDDLDLNGLPEFITSLQHATTMIKPSAFPIVNKIRKITAVINDPTGPTDKPLKFTAGLTLAVPVDVMLENVPCTSNIRIKKKFADQTVQLFTPKSSDFHKLGPLRHRLVTQVLMSHSLWTEPTNVELCVSMETASNQKFKDTSQDNVKQTIDLSKPVQVYVSPKQVKR
ncbi:integrator complex subunit 4-like [Mytilus galloprovincialis]|uniref:integrator complex subunit 4-like n=1 Tax=Mytilus galloprovincialis TaxID=29158 RepID=UPI003F7BBED9